MAGTITLTAQTAPLERDPKVVTRSAEELVRQSLAKLAEAGYEQVALRISEDNAAALALYLTLDFERWDSPPDGDIDY